MTKRQKQTHGEERQVKKEAHPAKVAIQMMMDRQSPIMTHPDGLFPFQTNQKSWLEKWRLNSRLIHLLQQMMMMKKIKMECQMHTMMRVWKSKIESKKQTTKKQMLRQRHELGFRAKTWQLVPVSWKANK